MNITFGTQGVVVKLGRHESAERYSNWVVLHYRSDQDVNDALRRLSQVEPTEGLVIDGLGNVVRSGILSLVSVKAKPNSDLVDAEIQIDPRPQG